MSKSPGSPRFRQPTFQQQYSATPRPNCFEGQTQAYVCGNELRTHIANETAITKEGSRRLCSDSEDHTTSLLDNRDRNYRQSSVIVCSLLVYQTHNKRKHCKTTWCLLWCRGLHSSKTMTRWAFPMQRSCNCKTKGSRTLMIGLRQGHDQTDSG